MRGDALWLRGIGPETLVVVYGAEPAGTMAAARLCWGLMYAGVRRVELLDGVAIERVVFGGAVVRVEGEAL